MMHTVRACCEAGKDRARGFIENPDGESLVGYNYSNLQGPAIAQISHYVEERVAWHESAHAAVAYLFGWEIESVSIVPPEAVIFSKDQHPAWQDAVVALAGPAGMDSRVLHFIEEPPASVSDYIVRAYDFCGGQCDECKAASAAWRVVGVTSGPASASAVWRATELEARRICNLPSTRAAIGELAATLMITPEMHAAAVRTVLTKHLKFGEMADRNYHQ